MALRVHTLVIICSTVFVSQIVVAGEATFEGEGEDQVVSDENALRPEFEAVLRGWKEKNKTEYDSPMVPPWVHDPNLPSASMGWRMGPREHYRSAFVAWLRSMDTEARRTFILENPEPRGWSGYYERLGLVD